MFLLCMCIIWYVYTHCMYIPTVLKKLSELEIEKYKFKTIKKIYMGNDFRKMKPVSQQTTLSRGSNL